MFRNREQAGSQPPDRLNRRRFRNPLALAIPRGGGSAYSAFRRPGHLPFRNRHDERDGSRGRADLTHLCVSAGACRARRSTRGVRGVATRSAALLRYSVAPCGRYHPRKSDEGRCDSFKTEFNKVRPSDGG